jgi:hypothetical protein
VRRARIRGRAHGAHGQVGLSRKGAGVRVLEKLRNRVGERFAAAVARPLARKIAWWVAGIIVVYTIIGFLVLPPVAKRVAVRELAKVLGREVSIQSIRFNPYTLALNISGFVVKERGSPELFVGFDELLLDFQLASLVRRGPVLREIRLQSPRVRITRHRDGSYNFSDLIARPPSEPKPAAKAEPLRFSLNNIQVLDGRIDFDDEPAAVRHQVKEINLSLPFLSNLPYAVDTYVQPSFHAVVNGTPFALAGETKPFEDSLESTVEINLDHLDLTRYLPYVPTKLGFKIPSGLLDTRLTASFRRERLKPPSLTLSGRVTLEKFVITEPDDRPVLNLPMLAVKVDSAEIFAEKFHLGHVLLQGPEIQVRRDGAGKINLLSLAPAGAAKEEGQGKKAGAVSQKKGTLSLDLDELKIVGATIRASDKMPAKPLRADIEGLNVQVEKFTLAQSHSTRPAGGPEREPEETPPTNEAPPWVFTVKKATVDGSGVVVPDETAAEPVAIRAEPIHAEVEDLGNEKGSKAQIALRLAVNRKGSVGVAGTVGLSPLAADLSVDVEKLDLVPLQSYVTDRVKILVRSGEIMVKGRLGLEAAGEAPPGVSFAGEMNLGRFASVDRATSEDFLKWKSLFVAGIRATVNPTRLVVKEVSLSDFYSRLIVHPDGTLNVREVLEPLPEKGEEGATPQPQATSPPVPRAGEPPVIKIGTVVLQGGNVNFTDHFIKPNYSANLTDLGGRISGLSSEPGTTAELEILGRLNKSAPLEIKGKVNPLVANPSLDLKASVKGIELEAFTPYSGKYAGYAIDKGKLSFTVDYEVEHRKLKASNQLILDQLTFGEKIESPTATKLPVLLAVALLKDRNGLINLNLPISGSLDDPKFSVGSVILQVVVNLLAKAATSPFALLGAVFGGGEELSFVQFQPGLATLDAGALDKLAKLGKALNDRPGLSVEVSGRADPAVDRDGLKTYLLERAVKAEKLKDLVKKGESVGSVNEVTVEPGEYEKYLRRAYREAKFPKPRNFIGMVKDLPVPEMEKLIVTNTKITDEDLVQLANERAQAAADFLINSQQVPADRVFLVSPKIGAVEKGEKGAGSRVEFALK